MKIFNLKSIITKTLTTIGVPYLFRLLFQRRKATILIFHSPSHSGFKKAVQIIKKNYSPISLKKYIEIAESNEWQKLPKYPLIITFDDGHASNYKLLPIIKDEEIPVTIFLTTSYIGTNRKFWFKELQNLGLTKSSILALTNKERIKLLSEKGVLPEKEQPIASALSFEQILEMRESVDFQSHSVTHPILSNCDEKEALYEMKMSKDFLEKQFDQAIYSFAYPNGNYTSRDISLLKKAGYKCALTINQWYTSKKDNLFELNRIGTNDSDSASELAIRICGFWALIKRVYSGSQPKGNNLHNRATQQG